MEGCPVDTAMARIDAALARLVTAMERSAARTRELSRRHERLKASVGEAIGEIDALIARSEP
jgi:hypothetical protein